MTFQALTMVHNHHTSLLALGSFSRYKTSCQCLIELRTPAGPQGFPCFRQMTIVSITPVPSVF